LTRSADVGLGWDLADTQRRLRSSHLNSLQDAWSWLKLDFHLDRLSGGDLKLGHSEFKVSRRVDDNHGATGDKTVEHEATDGIRDSVGVACLNANGRAGDRAIRSGFNNVAYDPAEWSFLRGHGGHRGTQ